MPLLATVSNANPFSDGGFESPERHLFHFTLKSPHVFFKESGYKSIYRADPRIINTGFVGVAVVVFGGWAGAAPQKLKYSH